MNRLWVGQSWFQFLAGARGFSLLQSIHTCAGAQPVSCQCAPATLFKWGKGTVAWDDHSLASGTEFKNG